MDVNITLQNPNLGLFMVETQKDGAACPHAQLSTKTGNKGDLNSGNLGSSLDAAALIPGKHDLGNLNMGLSGLGNAIQPGMVTESLAHATSSSRQLPSMAADKHASFIAGPSYAQILNTGNNAPNENGNDAIAAPFIAPESCKPSIKVKNAFLLLKKDLGAEVQSVGEPSLGKQKAWADEVAEGSDFDKQVNTSSNNEETLLHDVRQHPNPDLREVERELVNEKDHAQPQTLMDHGNAHTKAISEEENKQDLPTQPMPHGTEAVYRPITKSPFNPEVPVKNAFSLLKKDLGAEIQTVGEPSLGKQKTWADEVAEGSDFDKQDPNPDLREVERELVNEKDHAQPQTLMDHGNAHTKAISDEENKRDPPTQPMPHGTEAVTSSIEESNSDSLNTSDLSPSKVFARDE
ncbi:hypothetical protein TorRG33x02_140650, partial [Trema orientale]